MPQYPAQMGQDLDIEARKRLVFDNCDRPDDLEYFKPFSDEELDRMKVKIADCNLEIDRINAEKADAMKQYNDALKFEKTGLKESLKHYKEKGRFVTERVGLFFDYDSKTVYAYNEQGQHVETRRMRPHEMQQQLPFAVHRNEDADKVETSRKTGTND